MQSTTEFQMTVSADAPAPCAWCEIETGIRTEGSHGICKRHETEVLANYFKSKGRTAEETEETL